MNYKLSQMAEFLTYGEVIEGVRINCPNCRTPHAAWFKNPIGASESSMTGRPLWDRTGDTLESLTLHPSFQAFGCYHSWIKNGELQIDSAFSCATMRD
jgi:hypothetical protein